MDSLSIIICSRGIDISSVLKENILNTIGVDYELIVIDNSKNKYSIFSAYNEGVDRAANEYLCFMHEDILYRSKDWGKKAVNYLKDPLTGIIGIAGGTALPSCPAGWWNGGSLNIIYKNIIQHRPVNKKERKSFDNYSNSYMVTVNHDLINPFNSDKAEALSIDGVWFCAHKKVFSLCRFDDHTYNGFHSYDTDICLQASVYFHQYVVFDILIEHFSTGHQNLDWIEAGKKLAYKWKDRLPVILGEVSKNQVKEFQDKNLKSYFSLLASLCNHSAQIRSEIKKYEYSLVARWYLSVYYTFFYWLLRIKKQKLVKGILI
jgi:hypothetical protein